MHRERLLAGKYRVLGRLVGGQRRALWLAEAVSLNRSVVISEVSKSKARWLEPAVGVEHGHLAQILDVFTLFERSELDLKQDDPLPEALAVVERVEGRSLAQTMLEGAIPFRSAIQCVAHIAGAVDAMHRKKAIHGAISDKSVVHERADNREGPLLTQLIESPRAVYASPERLLGAGPGRLDDVWALHVLLYATLTGRCPFHGKDARAVLQAVYNGLPALLRTKGIQDDGLQDILDTGLVASPEKRTDSAARLEESLFNWLERDTSCEEHSDITCPERTIECTWNDPATAATASDKTPAVPLGNPLVSDREAREGEQSPSEATIPFELSPRPPAVDAFSDTALNIAYVVAKNASANSAAIAAPVAASSAAIEAMSGAIPVELSKAQPPTELADTSSSGALSSAAPSCPSTNPSITPSTAFPTSPPKTPTITPSKIASSDRPGIRSEVLSKTPRRTSSATPPSLPTTIGGGANGDGVEALTTAPRTAARVTSRLVSKRAVSKASASSAPPSKSPRLSRDQRTGISSAPSQIDSMVRDLSDLMPSAIVVPTELMVNRAAATPAAVTDDSAMTTLVSHLSANSADGRKRGDDTDAASADRPQAFRSPVERETSAGSWASSSLPVLPRLPSIDPEPKRKSRVAFYIGVVGGAVVVGGVIAIVAAMQERAGNGSASSDGSDDWPGRDVVASAAQPTVKLPFPASSKPARPGASIDDSDPRLSRSSQESADAADDASAPTVSDAPQSRESMSQCVSSMFPSDTFNEAQDMAFVCDQPDARSGASLVRQRLVVGSRGSVTAGMKEWTRLAWHQIPVWSIFRNVCCPNPKPIELPPPSRGCESIAKASDAVGIAFVENKPIDDALSAFQQAADCAFYGRDPNYAYAVAPITGGQAAFALFLERNTKNRRGLY